MDNADRHPILELPPNRTLEILEGIYVIPWAHLQGADYFQVFYI